MACPKRKTRFHGERVSEHNLSVALSLYVRLMRLSLLISKCTALSFFAM